MDKIVLTFLIEGIFSLIKAEASDELKAVMMMTFKRHLFPTLAVAKGGGSPTQSNEKRAHQKC